MRPKNWRHDRESFFKYTTIDSAKKILQTRKLRWSAVQQFNDPFDIQFDLNLDLNIEELVPKCLDEGWKDLHDPNYHGVGLLGLLTELQRDYVPLLTREEFDAEFRDSIREGLEAGLKSLPETQKAQRHILSDVKVLCLSETPSNILMWAHYANYHRGVVLELRCVSELDSAWGAADKVRYAEKMPRLFDEDFAIRFMSGKAQLSTKEILETVLLTKALDWQYEKEWRVIGGRKASKDAPHEDNSFDEKELAAVYFGCRTSEEDFFSVTKLLGEMYPKTKILRGEKSATEFELKFKKMPLF